MRLLGSATDHSGTPPPPLLSPPSQLALLTNLATLDVSHNPLLCGSVFTPASNLTVINTAGTGLGTPCPSPPPHWSKP